MPRAILRFRIVALAVAGILTASAAHAAQIRVLCSNGLKAVVEELRPQFEKTTGHTLSIDFSSTATLKQRIEGGETFDVALLTAEAVDDLTKSGKLVAGSRVDLARSGIGVGYRAGAKAPDVRTAAALAQSMRTATSIAYTRDGASRPQIDTMFKTLGIATTLQPKIKLMGAGEPAESVGHGESEIVLTLISEILPVKGVALAGPLPAEFQKYMTFVAATGTRGSHADAVAALAAFLRSPSAAPVYTAKGMERR